VEDSLERKPIHYASASKNRSNLRALVEHGAELRELDKKKMTPLMIAAYYGIADNVEYILQKVREHSYINFRSDEGYSALHYAILNSQEECVEILLNDPFIKFDS
jgi:ankyrin repeat protein